MSEDFTLPTEAPAESAKEALGITPKGVVNKVKVTAPKGGKIKVKATQAGYIFNMRRKEGDVFELTDEKQFSKVWMEKL